MRTHTLVFTVVTLFLLVIGVVGKAVGFGQTWTVIFAAGASLAVSYLVLAPFALSERMRGHLLFSKMKMKIAIIGAIYAPVLAGFVYWISQVGTVEALPIFPAFLVIFYAWIFLQAYFIAAPVTHALAKIEDSLSGERFATKMVRTLGVSLLFLPVVPLTYGVWLISSWLNASYQGVQDASGRILFWTIGIIVTMLFTFFLTVSWTWPVVRRKRPQTAVFVGGTFAIVWAYLLYRATSLLIGYLTQAQPANALLDIGLMIVSIFGAMQTFARKTIKRADRRLSQIFPFLVFSFGAIYAVAQLYFIVQIPITRVDLSIFVNATVFVSGLVTLMLLIRRHVFAVSSPLLLSETREDAFSEPATPAKSSSSQGRLSWLKGRARPRTESDSKHEDDDY